VKSGACDAFGSNRAELLTQIDGALAQASAKARDRDAGQSSLLDLLGPMEPAAKKSNGTAKANCVLDFSLSERLGYEKELLGFYITGHPLDDYAADVAAFQLHTVAQVKESPDEIETRLCGLITKVEVRTTKESKKPWARMTLEDLSGALEVLVFPDTYSALPRPLNVGDVVVVSGSLSKRDDQPAFRAAQILWLPEAYEQLLRELVLHLPLEDWLDPARWADLRELVMDAPGPVKLRLVCSRLNGGGERSQVELAPADHYGVAWTPEFKTRMETFLGGARYALRASSQVARQKKKPWQQRN
jgi:DNA polymerase III subunit alpha